MTNAIDFYGKTFNNNFEVLQDVLNFITKGDQETEDVYNWADEEGYGTLVYICHQALKRQITFLVDNKLISDLANELRPDLVEKGLSIETLVGAIAFDIADLTGYYFEQ